MNSLGTGARTVDFDRLQAQLRVAGVAQKNQPLFQVISSLIDANKQLQSTVNFNFGSLSNGIVVSAGLSSRTLASVVFSNSNNVSFGLSNSTITASYALKLSAGTTFASLSSVIFSNSNGISFGINGGTVTAAHNGLTNINVSAGATSYNLSNLTFSNSNGVSFGITNSVITASVSPSGITFSAGASSNVLGSIVFSNSNGVSFGLNDSTVTASVNVPTGAATLNYYENTPVIVNTANQAVINASEIWMQPILLQNNVTGGYIRCIISISNNQNNVGATSSNTVFSGRQRYTHAYQLFSFGNGASSNSLFSYSSGTVSREVSTQISNNSTNQYTVTQGYGYPIQGGTTSYTFTYALTSNSYFIFSTGLSDFQSNQFFDIPLSNSLSPGLHVIGYGASSTTENNGPTGLITAGSQGYSSIMVSQISGVRLPGTTATDRLQPALGRFSTNSAFLTTNSIDLSNISSRGGNNMLPIQIIFRG